MRRLLFICLCCTILLIMLVAYRRMSVKSLEARKRAETTQMVTQMAATYSSAKTAMLTSDAYVQAVRAAAGTNLLRLNDGQREKLYQKIEQFYTCYSSGDFEAYRRFRLDQPCAVPKSYAAAIKNLAGYDAESLRNDEDILRYGWHRFNGTNRLAQVGTSSMNLFVCERPDSGNSLRRPSIAGFPESAVTCWQGAVSYTPSPEDLLKRDHTLLFFCLDQFARMNNMIDGPATPLRLLGYWDPDHDDWRPLCLCSPIRVGDYDTMF